MKRFSPEASKKAKVKDNLSIKQHKKAKSDDLHCSNAMDFINYRQFLYKILMEDGKGMVNQISKKLKIIL